MIKLLFLAIIFMATNVDASQCCIKRESLAVRHGVERNAVIRLCERPCPPEFEEVPMIVCTGQLECPCTLENGWCICKDHPITLYGRKFKLGPMDNEY